MLDATYGRAAERSALRRLAARTRARLVVLVCRAAEATLVARLAARAADRSTPTASDARPEIWPELRAAYAEPVELAEAVAVDTTLPVAETVERALAVLRGTTRQPPAAEVRPLPRQAA